MSIPPTTGSLTLRAGRRDGKKTTVTALRADETLHRDQVTLDSSRDRSRFIEDVLARVPQDDWPEDSARVLDEALIALADRAAETSPPPPADPGTELSAARLKETPADVLADAEAFLRDPNLMRRVVADVGRAGVAGEKYTIGNIYLVGVSRRLRRPLAAILQGSTSSGKTYLIERVAGFFPAEDVIHATQMTPQALFHMPPGSLAHRWVVCGERSRVQDDESAETTRAMREMLSTGELTKLMPMKVEGRGIETVQIHQKGPIAFIESTTLTDVFEEDANRCILLQTDERDEQTRRVILAAAQGFAGRQAGDTERLRLIHQTAQRLLPRCGFVIPFAEKVGMLFDHSRVDSRRNFGHLMGLVAASALLHFRQRETDAAGNLIATSVDYQYAAALAAVPFGKAGGGVSNAAERFFARLKGRVKADADFSTHDAREGETGSRAAVYGWLAVLHDVGAIEQTQPSRGKVPARWKLTGRDPAAGSLTAPKPAEVFDGSDVDGWTHDTTPWE